MSYLEEIAATQLQSIVTMKKCEFSMTTFLKLDILGFMEKFPNFKPYMDLKISVWLDSAYRLTT